MLERPPFDMNAYVLLPKNAFDRLFVMERLGQVEAFTLNQVVSVQQEDLR